MTDFVSMKGSSVSITGTTSSASVQLPQPSNVTNVMIYNAATTVCFVNSGAGSATATTAGAYVPPGAVMMFSKAPQDDYVATIFATGGGAVYFQPSTGE